MMEPVLLGYKSMSNIFKFHNDLQFTWNVTIICAQMMDYCSVIFTCQNMLIHRPKKILIKCGSRKCVRLNYSILYNRDYKVILEFPI